MTIVFNFESFIFIKKLISEKKFVDHDVLYSLWNFILIGALSYTNRKHYKKSLFGKLLTSINIENMIQEIYIKYFISRLFNQIINFEGR